MADLALEADAHCTACHFRWGHRRTTRSRPLQWAPHHLRLPLKYLSPRLAPNCSIHVVLTDGANAGRLRALVANRLRETHFLSRFQVVELVTFDAIAMKVDLASIRRSK